MKKLILVVAVAGAFLLLPVVPAGAGVDGRLIEITKDVAGDAPDGPYQVNVDCEVTGDVGFSLDDGETVVMAVQNNEADTCTVTEVAVADVTTTYECIEGSTGDEAAECVEDNEVSWEGDFTGDAEIIITNTFDPAPTTTTTAPTTTTARAVAAPAAAAVIATPAFTG